MLAYYASLASEVYDLDKPIGSSFGDVEFYRARLKDCKGPILEPATGTGRILIPLMEMGLKIDGLDGSKDMLEICRKNCRERNLRPNLFEGQMESFSLEEKYEAIIVPAGSFLLIHQREDSIRALENFYKHLKKGGRLILDIFLQEDLSLGKLSTRTWEASNGDIISLEEKLVKLDYIKQYTVSHARYERWRKGVLLESQLESFPLRWYGVEEFRLILESIGFRDIIVSSNYIFNTYPAKLGDTITFEAVAGK